MDDCIKLRIPMVCGNLGPGYDTFGLALSFYNYVIIRKRKFGLKIKIKGEGADDLPVDESNVFYLALSMLLEQHGSVFSGLDIEIENNIPVGKGLGSYAAIAAAGIYTANYMLGNPYDIPELINFSRQKVGSVSSVTAALMGNFVITSRYENYYYSVKFPDSIQPVVFIPELKTWDKRGIGSISKKVSIENTNFNITHAAMLIASLFLSTTKNGEDILQYLKYAFDDRIRSVSKKFLFPGFKNILLYMKSNKTLGVSMCNDGPSFICFFCKKFDYKYHIDNIKSILNDYNVEVQVMELEVDKTGIVMV